MGSILQSSGFVPSHKSITNPVIQPQFLGLGIADGLKKKVNTYQRFNNVRA